MQHPLFMIMFALVVAGLSMFIWAPPILDWLIKKLQEAEARKAKG